MTRSPWALTLVGALLSSTLAGAALTTPIPGRALELRGSTYFVKAPWKAELIT
jgi:hypothetical protein